MYERAIEKLGGAFKLTVLVQKRVREIIRGASPLVPVTSDMSPIDIALKEVLEDKIGLSEEMMMRGAGAEKEADEKAEAKEEKKPKAKAKKKKSEDGAEEE